MTDESMDEAFESWWEGDPDDEPITGVSKEEAYKVFIAGYLWGSRKPVYQMGLSQYEMLVKMIRKKLEEEYK